MTRPTQIKLREGIRVAMSVSAEANKFITETEPFKVVKTDPEHAATLVAACECACVWLRVCCCVCRRVWVCADMYGDSPQDTVCVCMCVWLGG